MMPLNINTATTQDVEELGFSPDMAKYIIDYREYLKPSNQVGFAGIDDLKKIDLTPDELNRLVSNVTFDDETQSSNSMSSNLNNMLGSIGSIAAGTTAPAPKEDEVLLASNDPNFEAGETGGNKEAVKDQVTVANGVKLQISDFIRCRFNGNQTDYIGEITNVSGDGSFGCMFQNVKGLVTFNKEGVIISSDNESFFGPGQSILPSFDQFRKQEAIPYATAQYVVVTFNDNKKYLGTLLSIAPNYQVQFMLSKKNYWFSYDLEIIKSEGAYKKGSPIFAIEVYKLVITESPDQFSFDERQGYKALEKDLHGILNGSGNIYQIELSALGINPSGN